jgi:glycosyltransferase involved in cell wall biosynthesis
MSDTEQPGVLLLTTFLRGGAGRCVTDLAVGMHQTGRRVAVVTTRTAVGDHSNYPEYLHRLRQAGVDHLRIDSTFSRERHHNQAAAAAIASAFDLDEFSVIHAHAGTPSRIGLMLAPRPPRPLAVVQTMHGWGDKKTAEQEAQDVATMNLVSRVITTSHASAADVVARGVSSLRVVTIPCGIDETVQPQPLPASFAPVAAARASGMAVIACIGSLMSFKNQPLVVEALASPSGPKNAVVMFIGEGSTAAIDAVAIEFGVADRVFHLGYQAAASALLTHSDVLVQASTTEGQGLAVLEAMRARVPVVASDIPALRELVADGQTGYLFRSNDADALGTALSRALEAPPAERDELLDLAEAVFRHRYTATVMSRSHDALYELVAKNTAREQFTIDN